LIGGSNVSCSCPARSGVFVTTGRRFAVTGAGAVGPPDSTAADDTTAAVPESIVAETTVASSAPESTAAEILPPDESWGGATLGEWGALPRLCALK
jgi:hypothetical protein